MIGQIDNTIRRQAPVSPLAYFIYGGCLCLNETKPGGGRRSRSAGWIRTEGPTRGNLPDLARPADRVPDRGRLETVARRVRPPPGRLAGPVRGAGRRPGRPDPGGADGRGPAGGRVRPA